MRREEEKRSLGEINGRHLDKTREGSKSEIRFF